MDLITFTIDPEPFEPLLPIVQPWILAQDPGRDELPADFLVAGGAARSGLTGEPIADFDLFFDRETFDRDDLEARAQELVDSGEGWRILFKCPEGELLTLEKDGTRFQLIRKLPLGLDLDRDRPKHPGDIRKTGRADPGIEAADRLLDAFDFTVTRFAVLLTAYRKFDDEEEDGFSLSAQLVTDGEALVDTFRKRLRIHQLTYPVATLGRLEKYRERGYRYSKELWRDLVERIVEGAPWPDSALDWYAID
jgi:hypothetical protein